MLGKEEMHKNTFKPLCMLAAITLAFGISTSSAHAADTDLSITQKIDKITGKESQQKYTINYTDENKNTALKIEYDRGFYFDYESMMPGEIAHSQEELFQFLQKKNQQKNPKMKIFQK